MLRTSRNGPVVSSSTLQVTAVRGAYLYYAAAKTQNQQIGAATTIKYRMTTGTVKQQATAETSTCSPVSAELTAIPYVLKHARDSIRKTAHVYATTNKEALSAIEKGHRVGRGRKVVDKIADAVLEIESVGCRVTVLLVPADKGICCVAKAKEVARYVIEDSSEPAAALAEITDGSPS